MYRNKPSPHRSVLDFLEIKEHASAGAAVRRRHTRARANSCAGLRSMRAQELQCVVGACMREYMRVSMQNANTMVGACHAIRARRDAPATPDCLMARMVPSKP